jgi:hypothetical protein
MDLFSTEASVINNGSLERIKQSGAGLLVGLKVDNIHHKHWTALFVPELYYKTKFFGGSCAPMQTSPPPLI